MNIKQENISVVIPAYNEEKAVSEVIANLRKLSFVDEIIVVDDGSADSTRQKAVESGARVISHEDNSGYGASLKTGIINSKNNNIAFIDADAQHNPADLIQMVKYTGDHDIVIGSRKAGSHSPLWRMPGKMFIHMLANYLAGFKIPDLNCGLRIVKKDLILPYLKLFPDKFSFSTTSTIFFIKDGFKVKFVPVSAQKRIGESSLRVRHGLDTIILVLRMITLFEPFKIFLPVSISIFTFGFVYATIEVIRFRQFSATSLFLGITSLLVFFFGMIADQIATIRKEIKTK
ncbi:MAG TPA: glycosyltransferase family 2 protein [Nitrospirae bacterium]|nr:glycosyltransferase family 2 protein [Nitrospirota bacterium]HDK16840.1 glycosyltransferase family 2 protein [Nitrospirota bacterium]